MINTPRPPSRISYERQALTSLLEVVRDAGETPFSGQGSNNTLRLSDHSAIQFGDLRIELAACTIVVELESGGGVTNLVKYWHAFAQGKLEKPIVLLHIFRRTSMHDYQSHLDIWDFCNQQMQAALPGRFAGQRFTYHLVGDDGFQELCTALWQALRD